MTRIFGQAIEHCRFLRPQGCSSSPRKPLLAARHLLCAGSRRATSSRTDLVHGESEACAFHSVPCDRTLRTIPDRSSRRGGRHGAWGRSRTHSGGLGSRSPKPTKATTPTRQAINSNTRNLPQAPEGGLGPPLGGGARGGIPGHPFRDAGGAFGRAVFWGGFRDPD